MARLDLLRLFNSDSGNISVLENDLDPAAQGLRLVGLTQPSCGNVSETAPGVVHFQTLISATDPSNIGRYTYAGVEFLNQTFRYAVADAEDRVSVATVYVKLNPLTRVYYGFEDQAYTPPGSPVTIDVLANDLGTGPNFTITSFGQPAHGSVTQEGSLLVYQPEPGFTGMDSFSYTGLSSPLPAPGFPVSGEGRVTVIVSDDRRTRAADDIAGTLGEQPVDIFVLANDDSLNLGPLKIVDYGQPLHGIVTRSSPAVLKYTPATGFRGEDEFVYDVDNGYGAVRAKVRVIVSDTMISDDEISTPDDVSVSVDLLQNDPWRSVWMGNERQFFFTQPSRGRVSSVLPASGVLTYTPLEAANYDDSFTYTVFTSGNAVTATVRVHVTKADRQGPALEVPENQFAEAASAAGAVVAYPAANATDPNGITSVTYSQASETVFPLGATTVTVTATDTLGNISTGTFTVTVSDTLAPQITSVPTGRILVAGSNGTLALPDLTGEVVATDAVGVASVVQTPAAGTVLSRGKHVVTFVAADAAGNSSSTPATVEVRFSHPAPRAEADAVRATGAAAPGAGLAGGPPAGTTLGAFGTPALSAFRDVTARVTLVNGRKKLSGIHLEDGAGSARLLTFQGAPAPGIPTVATFLSFNDPVISPSGGVAFAAKIRGGEVTAKNDEGVWTTAFTGELTLALRKGQTVPGLPGVLLDKVSSLSARDRELLALVTLRKRTGGVTASNDMALLRCTAEGASVLLRENSALTLDDRPSTIKTITVLSLAQGSPGHGRWHGDGKVVAKVTLADKREAVVTVASDGTITWVLVDGDSAANPDIGTKWDGFSLPAMDSHGANFAVRGTLLRGAGGVTTSNDTAVAVSVGGNPFVIAAREGAPAPDVSTAQFATFFDPLVNDKGIVAFLATLKGTGVKDPTKTGLWAGPADALKLLARAGDHAVDTDALPRSSQFWSGFVSHALSEGSEGGAIFLATLKGTGVTPKNNLGLWAVDSGGKLREVLRTGDQMSVSGQSKTLAKMTLLNSSRGVFGTTRSFNDTGSVALLATFTDKSQALIRVEIP